MEELNVIHKVCCRKKILQHLRNIVRTIQHPQLHLACSHNMQIHRAAGFYQWAYKNACLWLLTCSLYYSFQYHHNFKLLCLHGPLGEVVEGAFGVNHMADREWWDEKELVCPGAETHVQLQLIQGKKLTFGRLARLRKRTGRDRDRDVWWWGKEGGRQTYLCLCVSFSRFICDQSDQSSVYQKKRSILQEYQPQDWTWCLLILFEITESNQLV